MLVMAWAVLGCSKGDTPVDPAHPFQDKVLNVFIWSDYLDPAVVEEFESQTGARIQLDTYSSDSELEAKLLTGRSGYDVVFPSDRSLPTLIKKQRLQKINKGLLPNFVHLDAKYLSAPFDPENAFVVPYFTGTLAIGIHEEHVAMTDGMGFEVLFDERYKGHITMLDDPEHNIAVALMRLGLPMNSVEDSDLEAAKVLLIQQWDWVNAYTSDDYKERLIKGEAWVSLGWSGDLLQASRENSKIRVIIPKQGTMVWMDGMSIPASSKNSELAHAFINYLLTPSVAAQNAAFVQYASPNVEAIKLLPEEMRNDPTVYLPEDVSKNCRWLEDRGSEVRKIERVWKAVRQ